MEKKILIAVDDSRHSENALRYAATLYETAHDATFVLLHVQPTISQYLLDEARIKPGASAQLKKLMKKNNQSAQTLLEKYKALLTSRGVADTDIDLLTLPRKSGVAKDILEYSIAMQYDAILLGRRGLTGLAETFIGSVSANVVDNSPLIPVWLVDESSASKAVMVAVDGSESSLQGSGSSGIHAWGQHRCRAVSFFHMAPRLKDFCPIDFTDADTAELETIIRQGDQACIDRFFAHARKKLTDSGFHDSQIHIDFKEGGFRIGKAILEAYQQGKYGTLVIGRRGMDKKFFTGSVSRYLINQFSDGSLWVVP
jgi:nucleotide-binding universal stress UspA family protein